MVAGRTLRGVGEAALAAEAAAGRSLTACATGFWANLQGVVPAASTSATADILYPFYVVGDLPRGLKPGDYSLNVPVVIRGLCGLKPGDGSYVSP